VGVGEGHKEQMKEDKYDACIFIFKFENRTMKSVKIVLRRGKGD
jgi:hypothetical protein